MVVKSSKWKNKEKPDKYRALENLKTQIDPKSKITGFSKLYHLTAQNPQKNIYRFYTIFTSKDLFGFTCVHTCYGRIGTKGRLKSYAFDKTEQAANFFNTILKKRLNSAKRIGVDYKRVP